MICKVCPTMQSISDSDQMRHEPTQGKINFKAEVRSERLTEGTYVYKILYDNQVVSRKIVLIR